MARITVEDCQERVENRFLLVQMAIKRVRQYREGYEPLVESRNKEAVTALREITLADVTPDLARRSGFTGVVDLLKVAKHGPGDRVYLVEFEYRDEPDGGAPP